MDPIKDANLRADARLVERVTAGNPGAIKELVSRLWNRVKGIARHLCRNDHDSEDLTQEAMLNILEAAAGYRATGCLEAWADVIAVRTIMRALGRMRRRRRIFRVLQEEEIVGEANPEQAMVQRARNARVAELLAGLNPELHVPLVLKLVYGYSLEEVSEMLGEQLNTVRYRLQKGRARLRELVLKDEMLDEFLDEGKA